MKLSNFFKTSGKWTQNAFARDINGRPVNLNAYTESIASDRETRVESLSLHGALAFLYSQEREMERREREMNKLSRAISQYTGKNYYIAEYNNMPSTTFEDIKEVIKLMEK